MINSKQGVFFLCLLLVMLLSVVDSYGNAVCECNEMPEHSCDEGYFCDDMQICSPFYFSDDMQLGGMCEPECTMGTCKYGCDASEDPVAGIGCAIPGQVCCEPSGTVTTCTSTDPYVDCSACVGIEEGTNSVCTSCCDCTISNTGPSCGDHECNGVETIVTCPQDCGSGSCPDGVCQMDEGETRFNCPADCTGCDYDNFCEPEQGETYVNCRADCPILMAGLNPANTIFTSSSNLITGFATYASCTQKYASCSAVPLADCDVCCPYVPPPAWCGNHVIDNTEECDNSASPRFRDAQDTCPEVDSQYSGGTLDCANCYFNTDACTISPAAIPCSSLSQTACSQAGDNCEWCPIPSGTYVNPSIGFQSNNFATYPYYLPYQGDGVSSFCVNTTSDPFNCGRCGFNSVGTHVYNSNGGGFCNANAPYCVNEMCVDRSYANLGANNLDIYRLQYSNKLNPFYFPYPILHNMTYNTYKANLAGVVNNDSYTVESADYYPEACNIVAGADSFWSDELGCCGDNKCRSFGNKCDVSMICNGTVWFNAADPQNQGRIFKTSRCFNPYPIAVINNEFMKCVDSDEYDAYVNQLSNAEISGCTSGATGPVALPTGDLQYSCPAGYYLAASVQGNTMNSCVVEDLGVYVDGYLVCTITNPGAAAASGSGFVSILNTNGSVQGVSFQDSIGASGESEYAYCPAPFVDWRERATGHDISPRYDKGALIPCPGMTNVSTYTISTELNKELSLALTGVSGPGTYTGLFCAKGIARQINTSETGLYNLQYARGSGMGMGSVLGHDYICHTKSGSAEIGICCGSDIDSCNGVTIDAGGAKYAAGDHVLSDTGRFIYCMPDGSWSNNMDSPAQQDACQASGQNFTGRYCCSEDDDRNVLIGGLTLNESYNDDGSSVGACFKGAVQKNNALLFYRGATYQNVFVQNGVFLGCGFNDDNFTGEIPGMCNLVGGRLNFSCLQNIEGWPDPGSSNLRTGAPLIQAQERCSRIDTGTAQYYCDSNGRWNQTTQIFFRSIVPDVLFAFFNLPANALKENCCPANTCWNPSAGTCRAEGMDQYTVAGNVYRCSQGQWVTGGFILKDHEGCQEGYCFLPNQCLYQVGVPPDCINDTQYRGDYLCNKGNWTTRTKMLAMKLSSLVLPSDTYQLMCGPAADVLNNVQSQGNVNAYCALSRKGRYAPRFQRIIGVTINQPLIAADHVDFMNSLDQSFWMSYPQPPNVGLYLDYHACPPSNDFDECMTVTNAAGRTYLRLFYDNTYGIAIMTNEDVTFSATLGDTLCNSAGFPSWLKWLCPTPTAAEDVLTGMRLANKLFLSSQYLSGETGFEVSRSAFGVAERVCNPTTQARPWVYAFNYSDVSSVDLNYLVSFVDAEFANFTVVGSGGHVLIREPYADPWLALTVFRNFEQQ